MLLVLRNPYSRFVFVAVLGGLLWWYWSPLMSAIVLAQQQFHQQLSQHIVAFQQAPFTYGASLLGLSLAYGIFHAAGPGHGKAVLMTYLATQKETVRQGVYLSFAAALVQALMAIAIVSVIAQLLSLSYRSTQSLGTQVEQISYLLVLCMGVYLSGRTVYGYWKSKKAQHIHEHQEHHHDHKHEPHCDHNHEPGDACNHVVVPEQQAGWGQRFSLVIAMGARPCSGALVVLLYARIVGEYWLGIAATLLMGLGTGITVAALGWFSVVARDWLTARIGHDLGHHHAPFWLRLSGGLILILLGWSLYSATGDVVQGHPLLGG